MNKHTNISKQKVSETEAAALLLLEQTMGYTYVAALRAAAVLGVADHLVDGPRTAAELGSGPVNLV